MSIDYTKMAFPKTPKKKHERLKVSAKTYNYVYKKCNGRCVLCGTTNFLELHHVLGRGKNLTDNYRYCVMLCERCHKGKVHTNLHQYRPILLEICKKIYEEE